MGFTGRHISLSLSLSLSLFTLSAFVSFRVVKYSSLLQVQPIHMQRAHSARSHNTHCTHSHWLANGGSEEVYLGSTYSLHESHGGSALTGFII